MSGRRATLIPNSFQTPNLFVDDLLPLLTGTEVKVLLFVARKTFGWGKTAETLTIAEIMAAVNGSRSAVSAALNRLIEMVVITREGEAGYEFRYSLQLDSGRFRLGDGKGGESGGCVESTHPAPETHPEIAMTPTTQPVGGDPESGGGTPYIQNPLSKTQEETQGARARAPFFFLDSSSKEGEVQRWWRDQAVQRPPLAMPFRQAVFVPPEDQRPDVAHLVFPDAATRDKAEGANFSALKAKERIRGRFGRVRHVLLVTAGDFERRKGQQDEREQRAG